MQTSSKASLRPRQLSGGCSTARQAYVSKQPSSIQCNHRSSKQLLCRADGAFRPTGGHQQRQHLQSLPHAPSSFPTAAATPSAPLPLNAVKQFDFLVLGSGIAGLTYAIKTAQYGKVAVITKDYANEGCTQYAQGGVCAVLDKTDSVQDHVRDTIVAGAFLNDNK